jgi:hypothetical protein
MKIFKVFLFSVALFINRPFFGSEPNWNDYSRFPANPVPLELRPKYSKDKEICKAQNIYWVRGSKYLGWETALVSGSLGLPDCIHYKLHDGRYILYNRQKIDEDRYVYSLTIDETSAKPNQNTRVCLSLEFAVDDESSSKGRSKAESPCELISDSASSEGNC